MTEPRRNLELKARHADLAAARAAAKRLGARPAGVEVQADTFFRVPHGRLKLREIDGQPAVLIQYDRPDRGEARVSAYRLVPVADPAALKAALASALGVAGEVRKVREIYLWHNVRIHLDEVDGLGTFVEFEAVLGPGEDEPTARERLDALSAALGVRAEDQLAAAYTDLLGHSAAPK
jgi:adenylate cyclase class IV